MEHQTQKTLSLQNRVGFHYFPDCNHFRQKDIQDWLPLLKRLNIQWLMVKSPIHQAIPENFVTTFSKESINLVVDFDTPLYETTNWNDLEILLQVYGKWGAKYAILDRFANLQSAWGTKNWSNPNLIETHTAQFIRFSKTCLENNIRPIYSPLYPGGDYWDFAFFTKAMQVLGEQSSHLIQSNFLISVFAWHFNKALNSADEITGNDEKAPQEKPIARNPHPLHFRNHLKYMEITRNELGNVPSLVLLDCGLEKDPRESLNRSSSVDILKQRMIYRLLKNENVYDETDNQILQPIPPEIVAGIFPQLSSDEAQNPLNWFDTNQTPSLSAQSIFADIYLRPEKANKSELITNYSAIDPFQFKRYVLLDEQYHSSMDEILRQLHPYLQKYKPLIGFSKVDASNAAYVIAIHPDKKLPRNDYEFIRSKGNLIKTIRPDEIDALTKE